MKGFIFELKTSTLGHNYYFIESDHQRKTKTIAKEFLDYFVNVKFKDAGFIPLSVMAKTFNKIYKEMYPAEVIDRTETLKCYHIHTKYSGESVPKEVLTIVEKEVK